MTYRTTTVPVDILRSFVADIFVAAGCECSEAERIAHHLLSANLTGHDSHGVIRTPRYVLWLREGKVLAGQTMTVVHETPTQAVLDGNYGFGQTIGPLAVDFGIAKARAAGMSAIGLRNAGHWGRIGDWGERAAEAMPKIHEQSNSIAQPVSTMEAPGWPRLMHHGDRLASRYLALARPHVRERSGRITP